MIPITIDGAPPGGFHAIATEEARRRQRVFQMGLFVCMVMLILDAHSTRPIDPNRAQGVDSASDSSNPKPFQHLKRALAKQQGDGRLYPLNATGVYQGSWQTWDRATPATSPLMHPFTSPSNFTGADESSHGSHSKFKLSGDKGRFGMQVIMEPLEGLEELSVVRGFFKLTDTGRRSSSMQAFAQGVFFHKYGRVTMLTDDKQMFLKGRKGSNVTAVSAVAAGPDAADSVMRRRLDEDDPSDLGDGRQLALQLAARVAPGSAEATAMLATLRQPEVHRRLTRALRLLSSTGQGDSAAASQGHGQLGAIAARAEGAGGLLDEAAAAAAAGSASWAWNPIGLTFGSLDDNSTHDPHHFLFAVPPSQQAHQLNAQLHQSGHQPKCRVHLDLKAGPSLDFDPSMDKADEAESSAEGTPKGKGKPKGKRKTLPWVNALDGRLVSADCRLDLNISTVAYRIDLERASPKAFTYSLVATILCLVQVGVLFRQLHFTQTQATASRISLLCIAQQAIMDAILCVAHLLLCAIIPQLFTAFASVAFFKLVLFCIVEMKYVVHISQSRDPQRFFNGGPNQLRHEFAVLHGRFYAALLLVLPLVWFFFAYIHVIVLLAYSYWVPQIVTNVRQQVRQPFHPVYLYGISATRLFIPVYLYACPHNLLNVFLGPRAFKPNYTMAVLLVLWTAAQVMVLHLQNKLGPQFMVPARFLPPVYNYRRALPRAILEASNEEGGVTECIICYQTMHFATRDYAITPCDHVFHQHCLDRWMELKMECPVCRAALPPPPSS